MWSCGILTLMLPGHYAAVSNCVNDCVDAYVDDCVDEYVEDYVDD